MKLIVCILVFTFPIFNNIIYGQSYFDGMFTVNSYTTNNHNYKLYDFSRENSVIKVKYFAQNAYRQYSDWKAGKQVLLVTSGAFSDKWESDATPVGLCVDNGVVINRTPDDNMDAMVVVYNNGGQEGKIAVIDMDVSPITLFGKRYWPRNYSSDRVEFLSIARQYGLTLFQTQLVYSVDRSSNFTNLYFGAKRERRFLAICRKNGYTHNVIVDAPDDLELNLSAKYAKDVLNYAGFDVSYILNFDTGGKNILRVYNGTYLRDLLVDSKITESTNLLVYYKDY
ncbi:hypothetical protein [Spirosoma harenae]